MKENDRSPMVHIFEEGDSRIVKASNIWGNGVLIIGYTDKIPFPCPRPPHLIYFGGEIIVNRLKGEAIFRVHPSSISTNGNGRS